MGEFYTSNIVSGKIVFDAIMVAAVLAIAAIIYFGWRKKK